MLTKLRGREGVNCSQYNGMNNFFHVKSYRSLEQNQVRCVSNAQ